MVICAFVRCSNCSGRDKVLFFRIPKVRTSECQRVRDSSAARRTGFLAAISRDELDSEQKIDDACVCSRHFISGKPADLLNELNPDWLPTQNLGHHKFDSRETMQIEQRYARKLARDQRSSTSVLASAVDSR